MAYRLYTYAGATGTKVYLKKDLENYTVHKKEAGLFLGNQLPVYLEDHNREEVEPSEEMERAGAERLPGF